MYGDRKKSPLTSATDVLQSLLQNGKSPLASEFSRWRMAGDWKGVVGDTVAANSRPDRVYQQTLYIAVSHPAWIQQLRFMKKEIIQSVNRYQKKEWITEVKFFVEGGGLSADGSGQENQPFWMRAKKKKDKR